MHEVVLQIIQTEEVQSNASQNGASYRFTDFSVLSNPAGAENVSCLGLCSRDISPKNCS